MNTSVDDSTQNCNNSHIDNSEVQNDTIQAESDELIFEDNDIDYSTSEEDKKLLQARMYGYDDYDDSDTFDSSSNTTKIEETPADGKRKPYLRYIDADVLISSINELPESLNLIPVREKRDLLPKWQESKYTRDELYTLLRDGTKRISNKTGNKYTWIPSGVSVLSGNCILVADIDANSEKCKATEEIKKLLGCEINELNTPAWSSGKPGRAGFVMSVPNHLKVKFEGFHKAVLIFDDGSFIEFRYERCHSVISGLHPETEGYKWINSPQDVKGNIQELSGDLLEKIEEYVDENHKKQFNLDKLNTKELSKELQSYNFVPAKPGAKARKSLTSKANEICDKLATIKPGEGLNAAIFNASLQIGSLIAYGLPEKEAIANLVKAVEKTGSTETNKDERTIVNGTTEGYANAVATIKIDSLRNNSMPVRNINERYDMEVFRGKPNITILDVPESEFIADTVLKAYGSSSIFNQFDSIIIVAGTGAGKSVYIASEILNLPIEKKRLAITTNISTALKCSDDNPSFLPYTDDKAFSTGKVSTTNVSFFKAVENSLFHTLGNDFLYLGDEHIQHWNNILTDNRTINPKNKEENYYHNCEAIIRAKNCIFADASMTTHDVERIISLRPNDKILLIYKPIAKDKRRFIEHDNELSQLAHSIKTVKRDGKIVVATNAEKQARIFYKIYKTIFPEKNIIQISAKTKDQNRVKAFLEKPNREDIEYDIVIYTPCISVGFDINRTDYWDTVYGFFGKNNGINNKIASIYTMEFMQQSITRCRYPVSRQFHFYAGIVKHIPTTLKKIKQKIYGNKDYNIPQMRVLSADGFITETSPERITRLLEDLIHCHWTMYLDVCNRNDDFKKRMTHLGHSIEKYENDSSIEELIKLLPSDYEKIESWKQLKKVIRDQVVVEKFEVIKVARNITDDESTAIGRAGLDELKEGDYDCKDKHDLLKVFDMGEVTATNEEFLKDAYKYEQLKLHNSSLYAVAEGILSYQMPEIDFMKKHYSFVEEHLHTSLQFERKNYLQKAEVLRELITDDIWEKLVAGDSINLDDIKHFEGYDEVNLELVGVNLKKNNSLISRFKSVITNGMGLELTENITKKTKTSRAYQLTGFCKDMVATITDKRTFKKQVDVINQTESEIKNLQQVINKLAEGELKDKCTHAIESLKVNRQYLIDISGFENIEGERELDKIANTPEKIEAILDMVGSYKLHSDTQLPEECFRISTIHELRNYFNNVATIASTTLGNATQKLLENIEESKVWQWLQNNYSDVVDMYQKYKEEAEKVDLESCW